MSAVVASLRGWLLTGVLLLVTAGVADARPWVLIDTARGVAEIRDGGDVVQTLEGLAFGRGGVSELHLSGDESTPRGEFRITRVDRSSRFHVFVGLNYPTVSHLDLAYRRGLVDTARYESLLDMALARGELPQNTILGGYIGLHGLGKADPDIHRRLHWTEGCVAMTDEQIDRLLGYIGRGSRVVIR